VNRRTAASALFSVLAVVLCAQAASPPGQATARLDEALRSLGAGSFSGSYTVTTRTTVSKLNGKGRHESLEVHAITQRNGLMQEDRLVRAEENGKDVTEVRRRQQENPGGDEGQEEHTLSFTLRPPAGDDLVHYTFGESRKEAGLVVASFAPVPGDRGRPGMVVGTLAWDPSTLDPVWMEVEPATLPKRVSQMNLRFEFSRRADVLLTRRTVTDAVGGLLWIKRRIHTEIQISDVAPD